MSKKCLPISEIRQKYYQKISEEDFIKIASADCISSNLQKNKLGKYAKWLLNLYQRKRLKLEDLYKAMEYIALFDKTAKMNKLPDIDLDHYTSLAKMFQVIKPFAKVTGKTEKLRKIKKNEAEKLYEDEAFVVIHPKTKLASMLYGKGTQWCTAAKKNNSFRFYNRMGKLYIIIDKRNGKKYQFHAETESFRNEDDAPVNVRRNSYTLEKINATEGLFHYLCEKIPCLHAEYLAYLEFCTLSESEHTEIVSNSEFRIFQLKSAKAWYFYSPRRYSWWGDELPELINRLDEKLRKNSEKGKFYHVEDLINKANCILCENYAGFFEIFQDSDSGLYCNISKRKFAPELDCFLKKLKIHPEWEKYCEIHNKGQTYYIVHKNAYVALYNTHFEEIIDEKYGAEKIIPFKDIIRENQLVIIKNSNIGIYYLDTDTIRWDYRGVVDDEIKWIKRIRE